MKWLGFGRRPPRLSGRRLGLAAGVALVLAAGANLWLVIVPHGPRAPAPPAPVAPQAPPQPVPVPQKPAPPPPAPIVVASVPASETYPLADWTEARVPSGFIDGIDLDGAPLDPAKANLLVSEDVLTVHGWAGGRSLGIRLPDVLLVLCGRVVATAKVKLARPDVAKIVHPNLGKSGWSARLLVGHLPRCQDETLSGWAVAPFGQVVFPLLNAPKLDLAPAKPLDPAIPVKTRPLLRPTDMPKTSKHVRIGVRGLVNVRRCGSTSCKIVGRLRRGKHLAGLLDEQGGWALVVVPKHASGWLAERVVKMEPVK